LLNIKEQVIRILIFQLILFSFPVWVFAEKSAGNCSVYFDAEGEQVAELYPNSYFIAHNFNARKSRILLDCWVKKNQQYDGIRLERGALLFNSSLKKTGKVIRPFNPMREMESNDTMAHIQISAYIDNASIDPISVPELELEKLLGNASQNERFSYFEEYIKKFGYFEQEKYENYESWLIPEFDFVTQSYTNRILMIFYNRELISIFHHRPVKAKVYDSIETGGRFGMIYNSKFSENSKAKLMEIYKRKMIISH
jgi:hypothetical protein